MDHADHINLLRNGVSAPGGVWADLGAGRGAFTLALADLLGPAGTIYAVDRDERALQANARHMRAQFPGLRVHYEVCDYRQPLSLPPLDGIVMANTLHFQIDQPTVVRDCRRYLRPGGRLLIVEYNLDRAHGAVLLRECEEPDLAVRGLTQQDLAEMVGASRESVTRMLTQMARAGIVEVSRRKIQIRDREALRALLESGEREAALPAR